ncbi:MAG TPA: hypothetical protein VGN35_05375, partial [Jatrophihabitantaceae bacterium]|nr:hypothetical protein [Jatrophihabitantaceae bacterium]
MSRYSDARRALVRRTDQVRSEGDSGFMLIYVLMVVTIISVLVGGTLVVTSANVIPSVQNSYDQAAQGAAVAGLNEFVAYANTQCASGSTSTVTTCILTSNVSGSPAGAMTAIFSSGGYSSKYIWKADKDPQGRYFRVTSTGTVKQGGVSASRTLIADVTAGASSNPLDFGVITGYETESPNDILAHYQRRDIAFDATGVSNAGVPIRNNSVTWSGGSPGAAPGKVAVCNATINQKGGRGNNPPPKAPNPYVDWTEDTIQGNHYTNFEPCQTSWGHLSELLAPANPADGAGGYFSQDAMLLSNSYPGGTGPLFNQPVTTSFTYTSDDSGVCGTAPGQNYRSFSLACAGYPLEVGGSPSPSSTYGAPQVAAGPTISTSAIVVPASACVYAGPTRVKLNGDGTATVTSPQTTSSWIATTATGHPAQCYTGATSSGM